MDICIVGTGYVGLVSAACLAEMGNTVHCVDIDEALIEMLNQGRIHIYEPGLETLVKRNAEQGRLRFTTSLAEGAGRGRVVCLHLRGHASRPGGRRRPSRASLAPRPISGPPWTRPKYVVVRSTVPVGTTDRVRRIIGEQLAGRGLNIDF